MRISINSQFAFATLIATSLLGTGCELALLGASLADEEEEEGTGAWDAPTWDAPSYDEDSAGAELASARLEGRIGEISFNSDASRASASDDGEYVGITLYIDDPVQESAAMVAFTADPGARARLLTPGEILALDGSVPGLFSYACSGDSIEIDAYEADSSGGTITVSESDKPGMVHIAFDAMYRHDAVSGRFDIAVE